MQSKPLPATFARSRVLLGLGIGAACLGLPGIGDTEAVSTLNVGVPSADDGAAAMLYAIHGGLWTRAGIKVEIVPATSGAAIAAAVAGGTLDVGFSSLVPLIAARARGLPFQLVAPGAVYATDTPYGAMIVKKESTIRTARELTGKTVSTSALRDLIGVSNLAWIDQNGGDSTTVKTVELPQSSILAAVIDGRIDAGTLLEPRLSEALSTGTVRLLAKTLDAYGKRFPMTAWFATSDFIGHSQDLIGRFARTMRDANVYCNQHPADTASLVAASSHVDVSTITHNPRVKFADTLAVAEIQGVIDVSVRYGVIDKPFAAREMVNSEVGFLTK